MQARKHDIAREMLWEIEQSLIAAEVEGRQRDTLTSELLNEHAAVERELGNRAAQAVVHLDFDIFNESQRYERIAA